MPKNKTLSPLLLATASTVLLTGGWLMSFFPLLIFLGLAPLFAIVERVDARGQVLEKMEYILVAFSISLGTFAFLRGQSIAFALVASISCTIVFAGFSWVRQTLGNRTGTITIIIFWLAMEYLFLKVYPERSFFLADSLLLPGGWVKWTAYTGYLGSSLWILVVNWCLYQGLLRENGLLLAWIVAGIIAWIGPLVSSYFLTTSPIVRQDMVNLYSALPAHTDVVYLARGEWVVRSSAWLTALILLFTLVRRQTRKQ